MRTIKLTISYDGTGYKGWQIQKNGPSVQGEIEKALKSLLKKATCLHGSGRTDSGVHARGQVAHFKMSGNIPLSNIIDALNSLLPNDIVIIGAEEINSDFHARYDAKLKTYSYRIFNSKNPDPFLEKYSWRVPYTLNIPLMKREAAELEGRHDFKSFQATNKREGTSHSLSSPRKRGSIRNIYRLDIKKRGPEIIIDIEGNGFLYNMVRNIVGTLVDIARGHIPPGSMKKILANKDRTTAGPTAPAKGLFLMEVKY
ncbi:MAG: tRNA pseudouridine(38-40) synthase TruA [Candidatus Omnitrophota bacterium]